MIQNILGNTNKSFRLTKRNIKKSLIFFEDCSKHYYELQLSDEDESLIVKKVTNNFIKELNRHVKMSLTIVF